MPIGSITRGTTGTNRLRRVDRWIGRLPAFLRSPAPLIVDLGFGASPATALEMHDRLSLIRDDVRVVGIEIDPARVALASLSARDGVSFQLGGFEVPLEHGRPATVIRAFNVLRQYGEADVLAHWHRMALRLESGGVLVEGTCSESGRVASWVDVTPEGPASLTLSLRLTGLELPSIVAERLPKVLIHRNVPGERIHALMAELDRHWRLHVGLGTFSPRQRWIATVASLAGEGWPVIGARGRSRLGELTIAWDAVAPAGFDWRA